MSLAELAEKAGVPGRTIRFYIARELLPGPLKAGRGAVYADEHLEGLQRIAALQKQGLTLQEIGHCLSGETAKTAGPEPTAWWQYEVAEDVVVTVRADVSPWRLRQIKGQLAQMARALSRPENN